MNNLGFCPHCVESFGWPFQPTDEQKQLLKMNQDWRKLDVKVIKTMKNPKTKRSVRAA